MTIPLLRADIDSAATSVVFGGAAALSGVVAAFWSLRTRQPTTSIVVQTPPRRRALVSGHVMVPVTSWSVRGYA